MAWTNEDSAKMDAAAEQAAKNLAEQLECEIEVAKGVFLVQNWWREHYRTAGHKRLARILLALNVRS